MKRLCKALALTICSVMLLSTLTVVGDPGGKTILTLEEAKKMALANDVQLKLQDNYIKQKQEDYSNASDHFSDIPKGRYSSIADKAEAKVNNLLSLDRAHLAVEQEVFKKTDLKRKSNYDVTISYYGVMKAKYSFEDAERAMNLAKKDLDIAKIKSDLGLITSSALIQVENTYKSSQTKYNSAFTELQTAIATLSKNIGKTLDVLTDDIDMTISIPNIAALDLNKIKEDYMKNSSNFFTLNKTLDMSKYTKYLTEAEYDSYREHSKMSENVVDAFEELQFKADRDYDNAKYQYDVAVKELDISLKSQYSGITTMAESIEVLKKNIENTRITFEQNKTKYKLGLVSMNDLEKNESALKDLENQLTTSIINLNSQYIALIQYSYAPENK